MKKILVVAFVTIFISLQMNIVSAESSLSKSSTFLDVETGLTFQYPDDWVLVVKNNINETNSLRIRTKVIEMTSSSRRYSITFTQTRVKDVGYTIEDSCGSVCMFFYDKLWWLKTGDIDNKALVDESDILDGRKIIDSIAIKKIVIE